MLVYSFTEIAWSAPMFYRSFKTAWLSAVYGSRPGKADVGDTDDPAPPHEQIPTWQWILGLLLSTAGTLIVGKFTL